MNWTLIGRVVGMLVLAGLAGCAAPGGGRAGYGSGDGWYGRYQGTGRVFVRSASLWLENQPVTLDIDPAQRNQLRLWGSTTSKAGTHFFEINLGFGTAADKLEGSSTEVRSAGGERAQHFKAEYALTREGDTLKGKVKIFSAPLPTGPFFPGDEWVVDLRRVEEK